ncbi:MAG: SurA N-terminal domain-containing protein, partial [Bullifex sp.]
MADTEKNVDFKKGAKTAEAKVEAKKSKKSLAWWAGVVILILISITFVLPATGIGALFAEDSIVFGKYNGEKIEYKPGNYFGSQVNSLASQYDSLDMSSMYSIWYQAYQSTVLQTALNQEAAKAGIKASDYAVNQYILDAGFYNNEEGVFDKTVYDSRTQAERETVFRNVKDAIPGMTVANDYTTILSSDAEKDYVATVSATGRTFEYIAFGPETYPDEEAAAYLLSNPQPFTKVSLSIATKATEEEAKVLMDEIAAGTKTFEEAALNDSTDTFASQSGKVGDIYFYNLKSTVGSEDTANQIFSTAAGSLAGPYMTAYGYSVFRVDEAPSMADASDSGVLSVVKSYIASNSPDLVTPYAEAAANEFYNNPDFIYTDLMVNEVSSTPANPNSSSFMGSFLYSDAAGLLSTAAADSAYLKALYT